MSILSQTYENLEVIVVNDGATDDSGEIAKKYCTDKRIVYIKQENAGVSAARNNGIAAATGDYIGFVDSDDFLEPQMYEKLLNALLKSNADMAVCDYNLVYDDRVVNNYSMTRNESAEIYQDVYGYFSKYCARPKPNNYIWTRIYKADIVKSSNVIFENYKLGDDTLFNFKLLPHIKKVTFIEGGYYNYLQRLNSNVYTVAKNNNLAEVYADTFDALAEYYETNRHDDFLPCLPIHAFTRLRSIFFYSRLAGIPELEIKEVIQTTFENRAIGDYLTGTKG